MSKKKRAPGYDYPHGRRGFASMPRGKRKQIASRGGVAAHASGHAVKWQTGSQAAIDAGRKGGQRTAELLKARAVERELRRGMMVCVGEIK